MTDERLYWINTLEKITRPVLDALAQRQLKRTMPYYGSESSRASRLDYMYLEALGRVISGIAPWLELKGLSGQEEQLRQVLLSLSREAIDAGTDPESADFMKFTNGVDDQPLVDIACLAIGLLRAPTALWEGLDVRVQGNVVRAMQATRSYVPDFNNHLLFAAAVEAFLYKAREDADLMRIDYALKQHEQFYLGDGVYGDGPNFHWDYYNSFVIHPFLIDTLEAVCGANAAWDEMWDDVVTRARRYAVIQERMISPEGTFPPLGRSLTYRFGAFHLLGRIALMGRLPDTLSPPQVRSALTRVIQRTMEAEGTFDGHGWLRPGLCGYQPELAEDYINTGSLYFCTLGLLPLGLPSTDPFWSAPAEEWTSRKGWASQSIPRDSAWE